jgi:hypothetical protein
MTSIDLNQNEQALWAAGMMSDEIDVSTRIELVAAEGEEVPFPW